MAKKKLTFKFNFGLVRGIDGSNGINGIDGKDGVDGVDGVDGSSSKIKYTKTENKDIEPIVNHNNPNPGNDWQDTIPEIQGMEINWMIAGEVNADNTMKVPWQGPIRITPLDNHVGPAGPIGPQGPPGIDG